MDGLNSYVMVYFLSFFHNFLTKYISAVVYVDICWFISDTIHMLLAMSNGGTYDIKNVRFQPAFISSVINHIYPILITLLCSHSNTLFVLFSFSSVLKFEFFGSSSKMRENFSCDRWQLRISMIDSQIVYCWWFMQSSAAGLLLRIMKSRLPINADWRIVLSTLKTRKYTIDKFSRINKVHTRVTLLRFYRSN